MTQFLKRSAAIFATFFVAGAYATGGGGTSSTTKLIVGDSIFALSGDIREFLEDDLNETIRSEARSGCEVLGGSLLCPSSSSIPNQYDDANINGIDTVIMNGGGNDFLLGEGSSCFTQSCTLEVLNAIEQELAAMFAQMHADGMEQIIFLGYYNTPADPDNVAVNTISVQYKLDNYPALGVDYIDSRPAFDGNERAYITSDDIHPTAAGSRVLADLILDTLN